ncbi:MAG TPA: gluconokinase [Bryobacteraceae bacterium]|nr:gluconokinase [Bryobacteraceae bacterium]
MDSVLTLDVGSSSARTLLFTSDGKEVDGFGCQVRYSARTSEEGAWEIDAPELLGIVAQSITGICEQMRAKGVRPAAVAVDTFWHSILGVDGEGKPLTPVLHPFDTRSAEAAKRLARRIDNPAQHRRTGCMLHPSYPPPKLLWLSETQPDLFRAVKRWMSAGEYLFQQFFGDPVASTSMVSASGLWDQNRNAWDDEIFSALPVTPDQFADPAKLDQPCKGLREPYSAQWPELNGVPWFPALGDGACDNVGSGCTTRDRWALMVGTSGAMRATIESDRIEIPSGLFCYRIDRKRFVAGGALSNGGAVYAWMKRTLQLPGDAEIEKQLAALRPGMHGLTILPLFAGERSPGWRAEARAAIVGLGSATTPLEILHAAMESVALRIRNLYEIMEASFGLPREVVGSGGALLRSGVWAQMMADTLCHTVVLCLEPEATSRGAALLALERLGAIPNLADVQPKMGATIPPDPLKKDIYGAALEKQRRLYGKLFEEN